MRVPKRGARWGLLGAALTGWILAAGCGTTDEPPGGEAVEPPADGDEQAEEAPLAPGPKEQRRPDGSLVREPAGDESLRTPEVEIGPQLPTREPPKSSGSELGQNFDDVVPISGGLVWGSFDGTRVYDSTYVLATAADYATLRAAITAGGDTIAAPTATLDTAYLSGVDVFYTSAIRSGQGLSAAEQTALQAWVAGGGRLIHTADVDDDAANETFTQMFGVTSYAFNGFIGTTPALSAHPLVAGVTNIHFQYSSQFTYGADALLLAETSSGDAQAVVLDASTGFVEAGCVLVFGDANMFQETWIGNADNTTLTANMVGWTATCGAPRVGINEIRIDQPGGDDDEHIEIAGPPGASLNGLSIIVIGDGAGSGTIEEVIDLTGQTIPASGFFSIADSTFTLGTADMTTGLSFENNDNLTFFLVDGFTGSNGDDLDTDDDCALDTAPWTEVVDEIALVDDPVAGDCIYSTETVGPDGSFAPGQVYRCPDRSGQWVIGAFDPADGTDTPGAANAPCGLLGDACTDADECVSGFCADGVCCDGACGGSVAGDCQACNLAGLEGTCSSEPQGTACGDGSDTECTDPDTCDAGGNCLDNHAAGGAACGDQGVDCLVDDACDGNGACTDNGFENAGTTCGDGSDTECTDPDTCDAGGNCLDNHAASGATCGDQGVDCRIDDACDGNGACTDNGLANAGTACGDTSDTECTDPDSCDAGGNCLDNHEASGAACGDQGIDCLVDDACDGSGACTDNGFENAGTACGDTSDTDCDNPDSCDGAGTCEVNYEASGAACGDTSDTECTDPDSCDGSGTCDANHAASGAACGDQGIECLVDDACDGSGACTDNGFESEGTACGDDTDDECNDPDTCDATGSCLDNFEAAGTACGDQGVDCLVDDACDGSGSCTDNGDEPDGTTCPDGVCMSGMCEPEEMGGMGGMGTGGDATGGMGTGGSASSTGGTSSTGSGGDGGDDNESDSGCSCEVVGAKPAGRSHGWLAVLALGAVGTMRRRRRH